MNSKVFISSTIYDLLDIRSELYEMIEEMGLDPIMSDIPDSNFEVLTDKNSIETCLLNLEKCDHVIFVLSQRYGPSLKSVGFDDYSATHLEYLQAIKTKKKIHVYVRDRLEADYSIWKKNKKNSTITFTWVSPKNIRLFEILKEHSSLANKKPKANWYKTFQDSVELKKIIRSDFNYHAAEISISKLLSRNEFPILQPNLNLELVTASRQQDMLFQVQLKNVSNSPAFNLHTEWIGAEEGVQVTPNQAQTIIAPGQEYPVSFWYTIGPKHKGTEIDLLLKYSNVTGYEVNEVYTVKGYIEHEVPQLTMLGGCLIKSREYKIVKPFEVRISK